MYQDKNVKMFQGNSARMFLGRFLDRNVRMFQVNSARMFQGNNARMSQGSSARLSPESNVKMFQDNSVGMSPDRSAGMYQDSNVNRSQSKFVMLPSLLMEGSRNKQVRIFLQHEMITETQKEALNYKLIVKPENLKLILMYLFNTGLIYSNRFCSSPNLVRV